MSEKAAPSEAASDDTLAAALARHAIELPEDRIELLARYSRALWSWNEKLNLTRHTDYERFVARDVVDTMALAEQLATGERVLDVGTGGGVPGVVLAIVRPDLKVAVCDSVAKKARAVGAIIESLDLSIPVIHAAAQEHLPHARYNTLVLRAVARLRKVLTWLEPHWDRFDRLLFIKGPSWTDERGEARHIGLMQNLELRRLKSYPMPGTDSESVVLEIKSRESGE